METTPGVVSLKTTSQDSFMVPTPASTKLSIPKSYRRIASTAIMPRFVVLLMFTGTVAVSPGAPELSGIEITTFWPKAAELEINIRRIVVRIEVLIFKALHPRKLKRA